MNTLLSNLCTLHGGRRVLLRALSGREELSVNTTHTPTAIALINALLIKEPLVHVRPGEAEYLNASDRDRLLSVIYIQTFGPKIESTIQCQTCGKPFDMDFSLPDLVDNMLSSLSNAQAEKDQNGYFLLPTGLKFRPPSGIDECEVMSLPPKEAEAELNRRCMEGNTTPEALEASQEAISTLAPVLDGELHAVCPECNQKQSVLFSMQNYLLNTLIQQKESLYTEIHTIARAYGWSHKEILDLPHNSRKTYVSLIHKEWEA